MSVWSWLKLTASLWLLRKAVKAAGWLLAFALVIAAWPLTLVILAGYAAAWWKGWPPARLLREVAWSLIMLPVWLAAAAVHVHRVRADALAPVRAWEHGWPYPSALAAAREFALLAPAAIPAGLLLAAGAWAWRNYAITTGLAGITASAPITFDRRQWARQVRTARGLNKAPGMVPLVGRGSKIPVGATIRTSGHHWNPVFALPATACLRHMVIVGATGSGKTNLMIRLWAGWYTATLDAHHAGTGHRPQLIVLDCKGGPDARRKAARTRRLLYGAGARRVAVWPDEARLSLWDLPARDLAVLLYQMTETGTGGAAYYADILQAVLILAVTAPAGPPVNAAGFLDRLTERWLRTAWSDGHHPDQLARVHAAARHLPDIQLRMATLLDRLGPALDGPGNLADADAWYFILEGTSEPSVAEAQAMALTELAAHAAVNPYGQPRAMLLAADDYSAVSGRVPLSNLYERGRSLGIGVQVSAQSCLDKGPSKSPGHLPTGICPGQRLKSNTCPPIPQGGTVSPSVIGHRLPSRVSWLVTTLNRNPWRMPYPAW